MTDTVSLAKLVADLQNADQKDDKVFHNVVSRAIDLLMLLDSDLAQYFGTSRTTVMRWKSGANAPHPAMRKHVFKWLMQRAKAFLRKQKEPAFAGLSNR